MFHTSHSSIDGSTAELAVLEFAELELTDWDPKRTSCSVSKNPPRFVRISWRALPFFSSSIFEIVCHTIREFLVMPQNLFLLFMKVFAVLLAGVNYHVYSFRTTIKSSIKTKFSFSFVNSNFPPCRSFPLWHPRRLYTLCWFVSKYCWRRMQGVAGGILAKPTQFWNLRFRTSGSRQKAQAGNRVQNLSPIHVRVFLKHKVWTLVSNATKETKLWLA
jgi:hypothetical protein